MCLKYFIGHSACNHHEYLGSHHCSLRPCSLETQHFHYIQDDFPVPWSEGGVGRGAGACGVCVRDWSVGRKGEGPVRAYQATNDFRIREVRRSGFKLPVSIVREEDVVGDEEMGSEGGGESVDYDYKSLSDADDEEWDARAASGYDGVNDEAAAQLHREYLDQQLRQLPEYLMQQRLFQPFVPPEACGLSYFHYPPPAMEYFAVPPMLPIPLWHGGTPYPSSAIQPPSPRSDSSPQSLQALTREDVDRPFRPSSTPMLTPPTHPLPPLPVPFIASNITEAYLRMQTVRRRRGRSRRQQSPLRDVLPRRSMALEEFVVERKLPRGWKEGDMLGDGKEAWSGMPFAGEETDTECGAEHAGVGSEQVTCRFSCALATL